MTIDRKAFLVVNPNSANASTRRIWPELEEKIKSAIGPFDWKFTGEMGEATTLTREAINNGYDLVVAVGGDGTNNEVVNGFFDGTKQLNPECGFGFICRGTGGDFRKTFGWTTDMDEAIQRLTTDEFMPIDLGRFTYLDHNDQEQMKHFINITSFGIGGLVDHYVNNTTKMLGGKMSFFLGSARAMLAFKNKKIHLKIDDVFDDDILINSVAIANGKFFGGGMKMGPTAEIDDGQFEVVVMGDLSKAEVVMLSSSIYKGTHVEHPKVLKFKGKKIIAESSEEVLLDMDGEQPGKLPCVFEVVPKCLQLKI